MPNQQNREIQIQTEYFGLQLGIYYNTMLWLCYRLASLTSDIVTLTDRSGDGEFVTQSLHHVLQRAVREDNFPPDNLITTDTYCDNAKYNPQKIHQWQRWGILKLV